jgi:hypothetical protein
MQAAGTEVSYRRVDSATTIDVRQNLKLGEQVVYTRLLAGFDRSRHMQSVNAICQGSSITCSPLLLGLTLDPAQLAPLPARTSAASTAYGRGQIAGGVLLVILVGLWLRSWHRRRLAARVTPVPSVV